MKCLKSVGWKIGGPMSYVPTEVWLVKSINYILKKSSHKIHNEDKNIST